MNLVLQAKKQLASVEKDHKSEVNTIKMKHDSKVALMGEEIAALKAQSAKYRRERETLKEMMDSKPRSGRTSAAGDESTELRHKVSDLTYQVIRFFSNCPLRASHTVKLNANKFFGGRKS